MSLSMLLGSVNLQLFLWLVIVCCLDYLLSNCTHLTIRVLLILFLYVLWYSPTILVIFILYFAWKDILSCHNIHLVLSQKYFAMSLVGKAKTMVPATHIFCFMTLSPEDMYTNLYVYMLISTYICENIYIHACISILPGYSGFILIIFR